MKTFLFQNLILSCTVPLIQKIWYKNFSILIKGYKMKLDFFLIGIIFQMSLLDVKISQAYLLNDEMSHSYLNNVFSPQHIQLQMKQKRIVNPALKNTQFEARYKSLLARKKEIEKKLKESIKIDQTKEDDVFRKHLLPKSGNVFNDFFSMRY
jgi:hypothetical protein